VPGTRAPAWGGGKRAAPVRPLSRWPPTRSRFRRSCLFLAAFLRALAFPLPVTRTFLPCVWHSLFRATFSPAASFWVWVSVCGGVLIFAICRRLVGCRAESHRTMPIHHAIRSLSAISPCESAAISRERTIRSPRRSIPFSLPRLARRTPGTFAAPTTAFLLLIVRRRVSPLGWQTVFPPELRSDALSPLRVLSLLWTWKLGLAICAVLARPQGAFCWSARPEGSRVLHPAPGGDSRGLRQRRVPLGAKSECARSATQRNRACDAINPERAGINQQSIAELENRRSGSACKAARNFWSRRLATFKPPRPLQRPRRAFFRVHAGEWRLTFHPTTAAGRSDTSTSEAE